MIHHLSIRGSLLAGLMLASMPLLAQTTTTTTAPTFMTALSTGMVGLAATQTAQLNVVNLTAQNTTTTVSFPCEIQLEFWDSQGKLVKSVEINNLAPNAAGSLAIKLSDVTSNTSPLRTEIRGVLRDNPVYASAQQGPFIPASCAVAATLEVFDTATGVTQSLTSDMHSIENIGVVPLIMTPR